MNAGDVLSLTGVGVKHDERGSWTPADVSFDIRPGEVVLLLGPSGCGKSTLALALNGLIPHAIGAELAGTVIADGIDTAGASVARLSEHVAMVFQDPDAQIITTSVLDEVCFGPENLMLPVETVLKRAEKALRQVGLWERRSESPDRLSGGGKQRLAIACALTMGAPLLVLDEPTANLDPQGIVEVYAALKAAIVENPERAILLIEHNLDAAVRLIDRVIVLDRDGRLVFDGSVDAVLRDSADALLESRVWLPVSTLAALRLRGAGLAMEPLPLTPGELTAQVDVLDELPQRPHRSREAQPPQPPLPQPQPQRPQQAQRTPAGADLRPAATIGTGLGGAVAVRGLTVTRGGLNVLHDVDLDVPSGDFLAVVGANGAGKTTLVQAIAGVAPPPKGTVRILDGNGRSERDPRVGFVFQNPEHQFLAHTVFDELAHGPRIEGVRGRALEDAIESMMERFGLSAFRNEHPFLLSGGQKRRLSVATALITGAGILVLDEPTFGQDRERAGELLALLSELNATGTTVVVVTHDLQLVADHARRVAVLAEGRLLAVDTPHRVFADSALMRRAGLLLPPLAEAMTALTRHPQWRDIVRLDDLPRPAGGRGDGNPPQSRMRR